MLEMVVRNVREKQFLTLNLVPWAWERLQKEYGQTKLVVNAHMDEVINLTAVKGNSLEEVREFMKD